MLNNQLPLFRQFTSTVFELKLWAESEGKNFSEPAHRLSLRLHTLFPI